MTSMPNMVYSYNRKRKKRTSNQCKERCVIKLIIFIMFYSRNKTIFIHVISKSK